MGRIDIEELAARVRIEGISSEEDCLALLDELRTARAVVDAARKLSALSALCDNLPGALVTRGFIPVELAIEDYDKLINDGGE